MRLNNIIVFIFTFIFIPGCVMLNNTVNISKIENPQEKEQATTLGKPQCEIGKIKELSSLPNLPVIPNDKKGDNDYISDHLVSSINDHRIKLKESRKLISTCKNDF